MIIHGVDGWIEISFRSRPNAAQVRALHWLEDDGTLESSCRAKRQTRRHALAGGNLSLARWHGENLALSRSVQQLEVPEKAQYLKLTRTFAEGKQTREKSEVVPAPLGKE